MACRFPILTFTFLTLNNGYSANVLVLVVIQYPYALSAEDSVVSAEIS